MSPPGARTGAADATQTGPGRPHFGGLEALRALAATMVVVHHVSSVAGPGAGRLATPAAVMDGGVAVFFVLSGFLIFRPFAVALLGAEAVQPALAFWWRRVIRILPAYWLALSVLWAAGSFHLGADWWKHYLLLQPFSRYTALAGLVPAWSLSTEMCFYLVIPPFAAAGGLLLSRLAPHQEGVRGDPKVRARLLAAMVVALGAVGPLSRATAETWAGDERALAFQWLPTNLDLFASGMLLAVASAFTSVATVATVALTSSAPSPASRGGAGTGEGSQAQGGGRGLAWARPVWPWWTAAIFLFVAYAYGVGAPDFETGYVGWFWQRRQACFALFAVLLLVPAVFAPTGGGSARRLWSWPPLVWVGSVSYGLYLWHLGMLERLVPSPPGHVPGWPGWMWSNAAEAPVIGLFMATMGLGLAAAAASWYVLERPIQRWRSALDSVARRG